MYLPKHFSAKTEAAFDLMDQYPFATMISTHGDHSLISHVPLLLDRGKRTLLGHFARANNHCVAVKEKPQVTVLFHGPHTYITPSWYVSGRDVPTWNYAVVHVQGRVRLIEDAQGMIQLLQRMTAKFEASSLRPWQFELPDDLAAPDALNRAIVGFEIEILELEAKFKLSQNRVPADQEGVRQGLRGRSDDQSAAVLALMTGTQPGSLPRIVSDGAGGEPTRTY